MQITLFSGAILESLFNVLNFNVFHPCAVKLCVKWIGCKFESSFGHFHAFSLFAWQCVLFGPFFATARHHLCKSGTQSISFSFVRQVETFGSMEKKEKVEFILEQMRLCLAKKDFIRTQIISKKINIKYFDDKDTHVSYCCDWVGVGNKSRTGNKTLLWHMYSYTVIHWSCWFKKADFKAARCDIYLNKSLLI